MINSLMIKVLVENKVNKEGLLGEHGLSLYIQCDGQALLFDTGFNKALEHNVAELGVDLEPITKVVLSHGHFDHTGGLLKVASENKPIEVYAHSEVFDPRYSQKGDKLIPIGIPFSRQELEAKGLTFKLEDKPVEVYPGLTTSGQIERVVAKSFPNLVHQGKTGLEVDPFLDDLFLLANTAWGYVLILGCTHSGLVNTLAHARKMTGGQPIRAILGGLHLVNSKQEEIEQGIKLIQEAGVEYCFPNHCTGFAATCYTSRMYQEKFSEASVGSTFIFNAEGIQVIPCGI